jgi:nicotinate-nucleotide adenylyltransferase
MVELLCRHDPRLAASAIDAPRQGGAPNYTVDTLALLRTQVAPDDQLFMIVGADALADLPRWREPDRLLALAEWIAVSRPGTNLVALIGQVIPAAERRRIHALDSLAEPASATEIRRRLAAGEACEDLLLPEVAAYIRAHGLYGSPNC